MKSRFLKVLLFAGFILSAALPVLADQELDLLAVLKSSADIPTKCDACKQLRTVGTVKAVPVLAALLNEDRLAHAARFALEGLPFPEAVAAMRDALAKTSGSNKAGLLDSLGWRRDPLSVAPLSTALKDGDPVVASAAATALSRVGGKPAVDALIAALDHAGPEVQPVLLQALLRGADSLLADSDTAGASKLYARLAAPTFPQPIRLAAWRGGVLADKSARADRLFAAITGPDKALTRVALKLFRELNEPAVVTVGLARWSTLPAEAQVALLDSALKLNQDRAKIIGLASQSPNPAVRVAAWQAAADANDPSAVPDLAKAAAQGTTEEREAARDTLARLRGPGAREALLKHLGEAAPPVKAELLRALGERGDRAAASLLLEYAAQDSPLVSNSALQALRRIAASESAVPLLDLAAKRTPDNEPVLNALYAVCQASPDKSKISAKILPALQTYSDTQRAGVLPVLAELGTPEALQVVLAALRSRDIAMRQAAVRTLTDWPTAAPANDLLEVAKSDTDGSLQTLALRGAVKVTALEPQPLQQLALLQRALGVAGRVEDKRIVLAQLGQLPIPEALGLLMPLLADPSLVNEAGLAAIGIAEKLAPSNPKLASDTAAQVLAKCQSSAVAKRAWDLRGNRLGSSPFIQDWLVCGPFSQPGVTGAIAVFPIAFGPEKAQPVQWKSLPKGDHANLSALFPGAENCAAYLKTQLFAPAAGDALLLLGSDDGVKAWLNGEVVHSNNVDRGDTPDQDKVPIRLKAGANELMLKITQGGGGWSASARVVGADGQPVPGLRVEAANPSAGR